MFGNHHVSAAPCTQFSLAPGDLHSHLASRYDLHKLTVNLGRTAFVLLTDFEEDFFAMAERHGVSVSRSERPCDHGTVNTIVLAEIRNTTA
jgi:hypothetical protein